MVLWLSAKEVATCRTPALKALHLLGTWLYSTELVWSCLLNAVNFKRLSRKILFLRYYFYRAKAKEKRKGKKRKGWIVVIMWNSSLTVMRHGQLTFHPGSWGGCIWAFPLSCNIPRGVGGGCWLCRGWRAVVSLPLAVPVCAVGGEQRDICWAGPVPPCSWSRSSLFNPRSFPFSSGQCNRRLPCSWIKAIVEPLCNCFMLFTCIFFPLKRAPSPLSLAFSLNSCKGKVHLHACTILS